MTSCSAPPGPGAAAASGAVHGAAAGLAYALLLAVLLPVTALVEGFPVSDAAAGLLVVLFYAGLVAPVVGVVAGTVVALLGWPFRRALPPDRALPLLTAGLCGTAVAGAFLAVGPDVGLLLYGVLPAAVGTAAARRCGQRLVRAAGGTAARPG